MKKYRDIGLKLTPQRIAILNYLDGNKEHPSVDDIYKAIKKKFPTMSLATVYNTLESLRQKNSVRELTIDPDKKRFDPDTIPHHHLICLKCKKIVDIYIEYKLDIEDDKKNDFEIVGNHIEFYGICPKCRKRR